MLIKNIFYSVLLSLGILGAQKAISMENPLLQELYTEDYVENRDVTDIDAIFRSDWNKLEAKRPYNHNLVIELFEPRPEGGNTTKFRKVLRHGQRTVGFITYYYHAQQKEGFCEVGGIAPEYRKKGIAKYFLSQVVEQFKQKGADHIEIFCKKDNVAAKALYDSLGFKEVGDVFNGIAWRLHKKL